MYLKDLNLNNLGVTPVLVNKKEKKKKRKLKMHTIIFFK